MSGAPRDLDGLRKLYFGEFVTLYDYLSSKLKDLPSELHFEVTAAFDHIMRAGLEYDGVKYEAENVAKASGHLKRATFDAFKLLYKYTTRPLWKKLTRGRYESVPGFVEEVNGLWLQANKVVEKARGLERTAHGDSPDQWSKAFDEWKKLRGITEDLEALDMSDRAKLARRKYIRSWIAAAMALLVTILVTHFCEALLSRWLDPLLGIGSGS